MKRYERFIADAKKIKELGYRVFVNADSMWRYGYVVNDKDEIGYFQQGDYGFGIVFSTKHYGTRKFGSGFSLDNWDEAHSEFTREIVDRCFVRVPSHCYQNGWCRTKEERDDLENVKKYKASEYLATCCNKDSLVEL